MEDRKNMIIREINNDVEDIFCEFNLGDDNYYDLLLEESIQDGDRIIYRIDINTEDRQIWAVEEEEDSTLTLDEIGEEALAEIEEALSDGRYSIH